MATDQRTEQPSKKRLKQALDKGQIFSSPAGQAALALAIFTWICGSSGPLLLSELQRSVQLGLRLALITPPRTAGAARAIIWNLVPWSLIPSLSVIPISLGITQLLLAGSGFQLGSWKSQISQGNPLTRIFSRVKQALPSLGWSLAALISAIGISIVLVRSQLELLATSGMRTSGSLSAFLTYFFTRLSNGATTVLFLFAALILLKDRRAYFTRLKMTKQEVRDEQKENEGRPEAKSRVRRFRRELARKQMIARVAEATMVVVNPTHFAVALQYQESIGTAPTVVARGQDFLALRIRAQAEKAQIPVVENPPLARALYQMTDVGQEIPVELYQAVAEVLAYVYTVVQNRSRKGLG